MSNIAQKLNALALQVKALVRQINAVFTIKDDLTSTDVDAVLSANQGRILKETIDSLSANDVNAEPSGTVATHNADVLAHANLLAAIANLENAVGSVSSLDTVAQVIVPAINEVRQQVYDLSGGLANIVIDDSALAGITEKTWSVDKIITELQAFKDSILGGAPSAALDTIIELSERLLDDGDAIIAINNGLSNRVRFDAAQSLTSPQMLQARQNIGAAAQSDVDALALVDNNFLRKDTAAQGLSPTEKSNARTNLGLGSAAEASNSDGISEGVTNQYFTESRVRNTVLTGLSFVTGTAITAADSIVAAFGKLQKQITDLAGSFRYVINPQTGTTYTVLSSDVSPYGNKILKLTNAGAIAVTLPTPSALGVSVGDSFNIRQGGTGGITITGTVSGANTTAAINTTVTLLAESSASWMNVGG